MTKDLRDHDPKPITVDGLLDPELPLQEIKMRVGEVDGRGVLKIRTAIAWANRLANKRHKALLDAFHAAINCPEGVVPVEGEAFYDPDYQIETEEK